MSKYQEALDVINQSDDEKFIKDCRAYFEKYKINPVAVIQKLVDKETPVFENSCNALFDENLLYEAIDWKCQNLNKYCYKKYRTTISGSV